MLLLPPIFQKRHARWRERLSSDPRATGESLEAAATLLHRILHENLLPYWLHEERVFAVREQPEAESPPVAAVEHAASNHGALGIVLLGRYLWFLSALARSRWKDDAHLARARQAFTVLQDFFHDPNHGGFYWQVDLAKATPTKAKKHLYGHAFALYALSEHAIASGDEAARTLAAETFALLERHAHDAAHGGYLECFERSWRPDPGTGYLGEGNGFKLFNTHLHLLEALTVYHELCSPGPERELVQARVHELVDIVGRRIVDRHGVARDRHDLAWRRAREADNRTVSYGHELECIHLALHASAEAGLDDARLVPSLVRRFAYCMDHGFDFDRGGFYRSGPAGKPATNLTKLWWVQAEGLLTSVALHRRTDDPAYLLAFRRILDWIVEAHVDWSVGAWHQAIEPDDSISGNRVGPWKGPYHAGRAVLGALDYLDAYLPEASRAPHL